MLKFNGLILLIPQNNLYYITIKIFNVALKG